ncbi:MAG: HAD family hydrolase [Tindallia sp. MSAO_Bac2]|nr:MAG: HAD family hydrolase [Tindallia sp. MSAO_Bac2]
MRYETILFDMDGTLTDSGPGIKNSVIYALKKYGIEVKDREKLNKFIGPPLWDSFEKYYDFSKEEARKAVEYYREYYREKGMFENVVYEGIEDLLRQLKESNRRLLVATSKPEVFSKQILEHFDIAHYFTFVAGSNFDGTRVNKDEVIQYALENCPVSDLSKVLMIGDREHDIIGAKKNGIDSVGVLFGYGDRQELEGAGATYIVENVEEIGKVILDIQ